MKNVYEVEFEEKYTGMDWDSGRLTVVANGSAEVAVAKAKRHVLKGWWKDDETDKLHRCVKFRLIAVKRVNAIDI